MPGYKWSTQGTSRQNLYDELGLHSLSKRRWCSKLIFLSSIKWTFAKIPLLVPKIPLSRKLAFEISIN